MKANINLETSWYEAMAKINEEISGGLVCEAKK